MIDDFKEVICYVRRKCQKEKEHSLLHQYHHRFRPDVWDWSAAAVCADHRAWHAGAGDLCRRALRLVHRQPDLARIVRDCRHRCHRILHGDRILPTGVWFGYSIDDHYSVCTGSVS